jgi:type VI secretion system protein ImpE
VNAIELFQSGKLQEAIRALGDEVRNSPLDARRRTFLFELLCFAGEYDRAEKHLDLLGDANPGARMGTLLYRSAIHAERIRQKMFAECSYPAAKPEVAPSGTRNGAIFRSFADADERVQGSLEVFVAGSYTWINMEHVASIEVPKPRRLRDLLWTPAIVTTAPSYSDMELGEILLPVVSPLSFRHPDEMVRLGKSTVWEETESGYVPFGQKTFLVDGQEVPILELGKIVLSAAVGEGRAVSA